MSTPFTPDFLGTYTGQVRVRVCGLLVHQGAILLAAHRGLLPHDGLFWSPPGGGWQFGESVQDCLKREFKEETGLTITPGRFLHLHEFGSNQLQALELFFVVTPTPDSPLPRLGTDPEHAADAQLLTKLAFLSPRQLVTMPPQQVHPVLRHIISTDDLYIPQIRFR
ncbi:MAG TPA: NUDIX domain-containing protein [Hymenobacter sp.]|jgi:ADP-ribose pyrophosphatase YjhB (NUDIX family)